MISQYYEFFFLIFSVFFTHSLMVGIIIHTFYLHIIHTRYTYLSKVVFNILFNVLFLRNYIIEYSKKMH